MTAMPSAVFTAAQTAALERMEAASPAPESLRERVARALHESDEVGNVPPVAWEDDVQSNHDGYRNLADAALDVLRGPSDDAWIVAQLRALLREQDPDAVPIIARADLEAILDGDGAR